MSKNLFSPIEFAGLHRPHRVVMAPMTRRRALPDCIPSEISIKYYQQRAKACLIVSEAIAVSPLGIGAPGVPGLFTVEQTNAWQKITEAVHSAGGLIFAQLWHAGRMSHPMINGGFHPLAPSAIRAEHPEIPYLIPHEMSITDIYNTIEDYKLATIHARAAGFDGVEIHGANGYLIDQFLQSKTNHRKDSYGGELRNRFRFLAEVLNAAVSVWDSHRVGVRLSPGSEYNFIGDANPQETFQYIVSELNHYNLAYLHLIEPRAQGDSQNTLVYTESLSSKYLRNFYNGTLISAGGYNLALAQEAIQKNHSDMIAFGRHFVANPDLPKRLHENLPLNPYHRETFYEGGEKGYIDYPFIMNSPEVATFQNP